MFYLSIYNVVKSFAQLVFFNVFNEDVYGSNFPSLNYRIINKETKSLCNVGPQEKIMAAFVGNNAYLYLLFMIM
jgi:hypothetical protein